MIQELGTSGENQTVEGKAEDVTEGPSSDLTSNPEEGINMIQETDGCLNNNPEQETMTIREYSTSELLLLGKTFKHGMKAHHSLTYEAVGYRNNWDQSACCGNREIK